MEGWAAPGTGIAIPARDAILESHVYWYTFSDELMREWEWSERYPGQAEILRYLNFVADRFDLKRDIQFNSRVTSAQYDEAANRWRVRTEHGRDICREVSRHSCRLSVHRQCAENSWPAGFQG